MSTESWLRGLNSVGCEARHSIRFSRGAREWKSKTSVCIWMLCPSWRELDMHQIRKEIAVWLPVTPPNPALAINQLSRTSRPEAQLWWAKTEKPRENCRASVFFSLSFSTERLMETEQRKWFLSFPRMPKFQTLQQFLFLIYFAASSANNPDVHTKLSVHLPLAATSTETRRILTPLTSTSFVMTDLEITLHVMEPKWCWRGW